MRFLADALLLLLGLVTAPIWLVRMAASGKLRTDWPGRFGAGPVLPRPARPRVLIHAVSVGEVNAARLLVERLASEPDPLEVVVAATTNTGVARARSLFSPRHPVVRYPLDFSFAVRRVFDRVAPDVVVLVELEVWPAFTAECARRALPIAVVNGRLSARSLRRYRLVAPLLRPSFRRLTIVAAQTAAHAERFRTMGVPAERITVTGTMKWDTAEIADDVEGAAALADALGIDRTRPLVVAGSTARDEHELLHRSVPPGVQLLCAPRKPEWFDDAARALPGCARRSRGDHGSATDRYLLDTIGELRRAYALADVVVVGRSFGALHGSDMMEPIALGKPVIIGPRVEDFRDAVDALRAGGGLIQVDRDGLAPALRELLDDRARGARLAAAGRATIRAQQGATERHAALIRSLLAPTIGAS
jgi:3-deoxy-D-manno-octulosonic-acid transferase